MKTHLFYCFFISILTLVELSRLPDDRFSHLYNLKVTANFEDQQNAVINLIERVIPGRSKLFKILIDPSIGPEHRDTFILSSSQGMISITGTSALAASWGFGHYLKYYCFCQFSWAEDQLDVPSPLPELSSPVKITSNDRYRYYQNVCTVSYSSPWWQWERWEREIDWMALNAINLPLAFTGQEAIWTKVFLQMGLTQAEVNEFLGGPAFLAWSRMGNLRGWGGPLPPSWNENQLKLQKQILQRMRELTMIPVLPAFAGHVPRNISRVFPGVKLIKSHHWGSFEQKYCCVEMVDFTDPAFVKIGSAFLQAQEEEFGTNHLYNADTFNEMVPASSDPNYLASSARAVYAAMTTHDPQAVWVMQAWLFLNPFWKPPQVKGLLTAVPQGRMLLLDLFAEQSPQFSRFESFYGQPFIWCMLHNFGGTLGLFGQMSKVNENPTKARSYKNSSMVGTGLTPEGINQNYVMYEFMNEQAWRTGPINLTEWVHSYAHRRYGVKDANLEYVWRLLLRSVYNATSQRSHLGQIPSNRPNLNRNSESEVWYSVSDVVEAWQTMVLVLDKYQHKPTFIYDFVDVTRQTYQLFTGYMYDQIVKLYKANDPTISYLVHIPLIMMKVDEILHANKHFCLSDWTNTARSIGTNDEERDLYEYNARNQITLWGPQGNIMDYAAKQWAGVMGGYVAPRWELFVNSLISAVKNGTAFDQGVYNRKVFDEVEKPFTFRRTTSSDDCPRNLTSLKGAVQHLQVALLEMINDSEYIERINEIGRLNNERIPNIENPQLFKYMNVY